jgi:hypothetical protein
VHCGWGSAGCFYPIATDFVIALKQWGLGLRDILTRLGRLQMVLLYRNDVHEE